LAAKISTQLMPDFLTTCEQAARAGGEVLLQWKGKTTTREKARCDLVTEADLASQEAIRRVVLQAFPDHDFLGEEQFPGEAPQSRGGEYRWLVDPLDGTTNYVHQMPSYAVSVALERSGAIVAACVFDPELDECYTAKRGGGAFVDGQSIHVSSCRSLGEAMIAASLPPQVPRDSLEIARLVEVIHACQALRRLGSAALNLCYVAQGRLDGYWATSVKIWDIAAGMLIVEEAGGVITSLAAGPVDFERPWFAAAATGDLHTELLDLLNRVG
jgi:myo-inositol-1(or 4)-monophosphatase